MAIASAPHPSPEKTRSAATLSARYQRVRQFTEQLCAPLSPEDCSIQSMPDASPTRWHLAHTTWFFETFVLSQSADFAPFSADFQYLYNSYYNAIGQQFPRAARGHISRPSLAEVGDYRRHVDERMLSLLADDATLNTRTAEIVELGLQHEQQHQELILTDIKHGLAQNPLWPIYLPAQRPVATAKPRTAKFRPEWIAVAEGTYWMGHEGEQFAYDNEGPRHRVFLEALELSPRLVTCGEYLEFIDDGGYQRPEFWLSLGWSTASEQHWQAPHYWHKLDGRWRQFTLAGLREINCDEPVCHVSYFEADAFARWAGARLPTEAEWEVAAQQTAIFDDKAVFVDRLLQAGEALHPRSEEADEVSLLGNLWQWTASSYAPHPGYRPVAGAIGEYNGKFMCQQYVLRGGSCATHSTHIRPTYRNFFPPEARWQFSGIRLCRGA